MSPERRELENWLKIIDVDVDKVIDIGGVSNPVKGRTKSWKVNDYRILDIKEERKGNKTDIIFDLNQPMNYWNWFDIGFCLEVMAFVWNPVQVLMNIYNLLRPDAILYLSSHYIFNHTKGTDYLRYTEMGIKKLLEETGFKILEIKPRINNAGHLIICQRYQQ